MGQGVEREFKLRIPDEGARERLLAELGAHPAAPALQVNHFFDSACGALRAARIGLRLREEGGRHVVTAKGPASDEHAGLATRPEEECEVSAAAAADVLAGRVSPLEALAAQAGDDAPLVRAARAALDGAALECIGSFENERTRVGPLVYPRDGGGPELLFEFDRTRFPGGIVELEVEVELEHDADPGAAWAVVQVLFAAAKVAPEHAPSKAQRFRRLLDAAPGSR